MKLLHKYEKRAVHFTGIETLRDWKFKRYAIHDSSNSLPNQSEWGNAFRLIDQCVQQYHHLQTELKFGYIIYHKGFDSNYIVVSWWSHENMIRMFAYSSTRLDPTEFNLVTNGLNICVWDMLIHAHERNAFVNHILMNPDTAEIKNYLQDEYK